jgi:type IV secretion system protein VirB10
MQTESQSGFAPRFCGTMAMLASLLLLAGALSAQTPPVTEQSVPPAQTQEEAPKLKARAGQIAVPAGTRLPLVVHNSVTTRNARAGDPVYLEVLFPIVLENKILIPAGSYVQGEIVEAKRPGRVKGRGELLIRLNTLILPNGYTVSFNAQPSNVGTGGNETTDKEGTVKGDTDRMSDVGTVVRSTATGVGIGAGIGAAAGNVGRGAGIGVATGAAAGLLAVLLSRGPDIDIPRGSTLEAELNRPLYLDAAQINFTDPGRASSLAGPPNRQPQRQSRFP